MAAKKTGISLDLIIHPGETLAEVLEERGITQVDLAAHTGVSPAHVSNVISGKKAISPKFAMALEYALGVPKSFWINLQANYEAELLEATEEFTITEDERNACRSLSEVITFLRKIRAIPDVQRVEDTILSLRKLLQISSIYNLGVLVPEGAFRMSSKATVDPVVMGAWLRLCQITGETHRVDTRFSKDNVKALISEIKQIMITPHCDVQKELEKVMGRYGIAFSVIPNFKGAPVHGYISLKKDGSYQMTLTIRGSFADIFWFSLFHELGHIVNGDVSKCSRYIDTNEDKDARKEIAADSFASDALMDAESYCNFVRRADFSINAICRYAATQKVMPYIVIGRLQKDGHIPYSWYSDHKLRYKWA